MRDQPLASVLLLKFTHARKHLGECRVSSLRNPGMSIEIDCRGDPAKEDARYLLQPSYVAANVPRFNEGTLTEVAQ